MVNIFTCKNCRWGGGEGKRADGGKGGLQEVGNENELDAICLIQNMRQFAFVSMKKRVN